MLVSQQQNHLVFRSQSALLERGGAVWCHPLGKRKKQNYLENTTSIDYLSSATLHCYMHPLPGQTLEHLQTMAKQWATQNRRNSSSPLSSSSAAIFQLLLVRKGKTKGMTHWRAQYKTSTTADSTTLLILKSWLWRIDWFKLIISQMPLMSSSNQFGVCLHF